MLSDLVDGRHIGGVHGVGLIGAAGRGGRCAVDLLLNPEDLAFRAEVRAWVAESLPTDLAAKVHGALRLSREDLQRTFKSALQSGLAKLDLVTREEFEVQRLVLARDRAGIRPLYYTRQRGRLLSRGLIDEADLAIGGKRPRIARRRADDEFANPQALRQRVDQEAQGGAAVTLAAPGSAHQPDVEFGQAGLKVKAGIASAADRFTVVAFDEEHPTPGALIGLEVEGLEVAQKLLPARHRAFRVIGRTEVKRCRVRAAKPQIHRPAFVESSGAQPEIHAQTSSSQAPSSSMRAMMPCAPAASSSGMVSSKMRPFDSARISWELSPLFDPFMLVPFLFLLSYSFLQLSENQSVYSFHTLVIINVSIIAYLIFASLEYSYQPLKLTKIDNNLRVKFLRFFILMAFVTLVIECFMFGYIPIFNITGLDVYNDSNTKLVPFLHYFIVINAFIPTWSYIFLKEKLISKQEFKIVLFLSIFILLNYLSKQMYLLFGLSFFVSYSSLLTILYSKIII